MATDEEKTEQMKKALQEVIDDLMRALGDIQIKLRKLTNGSG